MSARKVVLVALSRFWHGRCHILEIYWTTCCCNCIKTKGPVFENEDPKRFLLILMKENDEKKSVKYKSILHVNTVQMGYKYCFFFTYVYSTFLMIRD